MSEPVGARLNLLDEDESSIAILGDALSGGGEMGTLVRAKDWRETPLGPPETWPQSMRTALSIMLESRFAMVVAWGPDSRFFYNDPYRPVLGAKHPASLGMPGREIFPEVWDVVGPEFERVLRGESFAIDDWLLPLERNGYLENCWFTVSYSPIRDESGGVGGVLAVVAETTDRVQGERRLAILRDLARSTDARTAEQACERACDIFCANTMDVPFSLAYLLNDDGTVARLVASSGLDPNSIAAPVDVDLTMDDRGRWPLRAAINSREVFVVGNAGDTFGPLPGGPNPEPAHTAVVLPLARAGAATYGALVLGVSPRRALDERYRSFMELATEYVVAGIATASAYEEERRRAEALAELNRAKTAFFSNVSHEFRTPLTLLLGPVNELLASGARAPEDRKSLELIERNALRLLKLVNTLLDFSRIEAGRMQARFAPIDLCAFTADLASAFRSTIERAGLSLRVDCGPIAEPVYVDREMWEKIVLNLISNAFKHTFEGEIVVRLHREGKSQQVVFSVTDTGIGIPRDEVDRVFERFHQVPSARSRTHEGSGIGLSLVRELVHLHGGQIDVASRVGEGSTFRIVLPLGYAHLPPEHVTHDRAVPSADIDDPVVAPFVKEASRWDSSLGSPDVLSDGGTGAVARDTTLADANLLVVDDNADMRDYLARLLADAGAHVTLATNGRDALDRLRDASADAPDVVLSDVMMPELDGLGLLAAMRDDQRLHPIPFIMLSARAGEEARVGGIHAGADDYLIKPFVAKELIARVAAQLRLSRASQSERQARAEAEEARGQISRVFEQAPVPICVIAGRELRFTTANAAYRQIIGNRDPVGHTLLELWPELEGSEIHQVFQRVFATGESFTGREYKIRFDQFGNGKPRDSYFDFVYHPLHDAGGSTFGIIAVATDVTSQVIARREAERLRQSAEAANEAKLHLLRTVSHETRQPVHASLGYVDLLTLGLRGDLTAAQRNDLENIRRNQTHLLRLLNDILSFAKLEAGVLELDLEIVEAATIIAAVEPLVRPQFAAKGVEYIVNVPTAPAAFYGDRERTTQICVNLLTNALKATEKGGRVTIAFTANESTIDFTVNDTGIGIPESKLNEIFDPFTSLARVRTGSDAGGVGLGLSISRQLARAMKGEVTAISTVGVGSTFTLSLPGAEV
jgi:signal transduction histidine kinase